MDITISWTIIKAGQHTENCHLIQCPYIHSVYAMGRGKTGLSLLFHLDPVFLSAAVYTLYKVTSGMEIFYSVNNFQKSQSQYSTGI